VNAANPGTTHRRALIACCAVFSCTLLVETTTNWTDFERAAKATDQTAIKTVATYESSHHADIGMENYQIIVERPLFTATRRLPERKIPMVLSSEPTLVTEAASGPVNLLGIVIMANTRRALLRFDPDNIHLVSPGESVDGWELREIEQGAVRLARGGREQRIELLRKAGPLHKKRLNHRAQPALDKRPRAPSKAGIQTLERETMGPKVDKNLLPDLPDTN